MMKGLFPIAAILFISGETAFPQGSDKEKAIVAQIKTLRQVPDDKRGQVTTNLALAIRELPAGVFKTSVANNLANLATEGDFGHGTLEEVARTLAQAIEQTPPAMSNGKPAQPFMELATLVKYEHVHATSGDPQFAAAMAKLDVDDLRRENADFTLTDLNGKEWRLSKLRGKVVLVNFWATWCAPCRKEMPDLDALYTRFKEQGFVVLAISDEESSKVTAFLHDHPVSYPVMLDAGRTVNQQFEVEGIPKSFIYNREGKLAAQSIDMRTREQFLQLLAQAGLH